MLILGIDCDENSERIRHQLLRDTIQQFQGFGPFRYSVIECSPGKKPSNILLLNDSTD